MAFEFPDYDTWFNQKIASGALDAGDPDFNRYRAYTGWRGMYADERDAADQAWGAQSLQDANTGQRPFGAFLDELGGYPMSDPEFAAIINGNTQTWSDGRQYISPEAYAQLVDTADRRSSGISPLAAFLAPLAIVGGGIAAGAFGGGSAGAGAAGAFDAAGLTGTGIPEAWGITGAAPAAGAGGLVDTAWGVNPSTGLDWAAIDAGEAVAPFSTNPSLADLGGVVGETGASGGGLADLLSTPTPPTGIPGVGDAGAFDQTGSTGTGLPGSGPATSTTTPSLPVTPGVGDAGAFDQAGSTGTGIPGSGPATSNAAGGLAGTLQGTAAGAAASGASTALSRVLDGTASTADYLSVLGTAGQTALGIGAGAQQSSATSNLGDRILNMGAPSLARYEASYAPGFDLWSQPGYKDALDSSMDSQLRRLSATGGNPYGNPGGLVEANKAVTAGLTLPALQNYRETNRAAGFGNVPQYAQLQSQAIGQQGGAWEAAGAGLESLLRPRNNYTLNLGQYLG